MHKILVFFRNPNKKFLIVLEFSILFSVIFYFSVLFLSEYKSMGFEEPIIDIPNQFKQINEIILAILLGLLSFELLLKYMKIKNWKKFLKKYWLDVIMVILIPVFTGVKIFKAIKLAKKLKLAKYGFKAADKTQKKIRQK